MLAFASAVPVIRSEFAFMVCGDVVIVGAFGAVLSSVIGTVAADDSLSTVSVAVRERVFTTSCVRLTDIEKLPPVAVPVAVARPPVMVIREFASAVPSTVMKFAFMV